MPKEVLIARLFTHFTFLTLLSRLFFHFSSYRVSAACTAIRIKLLLLLSLQASFCCSCCTWILILSSAVWQVRHATKFLTKNCQAAKNESYFIWRKKFDFYSCNVVVIVVMAVTVPVAVAVAVGCSPPTVTRCVYVMCHTTDSITIFSVACCTQSGE